MYSKTVLVSVVASFMFLLAWESNIGYPPQLFIIVQKGINKSLCRQNWAFPCTVSFVHYLTQMYWSHLCIVSSAWPPYRYGRTPPIGIDGDHIDMVPFSETRYPTPDKIYPFCTWRTSCVVYCRTVDTTGDLSAVLSETKPHPPLGTVRYHFCTTCILY